MVHISPRRTGELYSNHPQSPMRVEGIDTTGAARCPEGIVCNTAITISVPCGLRHDASHLGLGGLPSKDVNPGRDNDAEGCILEGPTES
jgi:hypothetical protein